MTQSPEHDSPALFSSGSRADRRLWFMGLSLWVCLIVGSIAVVSASRKYGAPPPPPTLLPSSVPTASPILPSPSPHPYSVRIFNARGVTGAAQRVKEQIIAQDPHAFTTIHVANANLQPGTVIIYKSRTIEGSTAAKILFDILGPSATSSIESNQDVDIVVRLGTEL